MLATHPLVIAHRGASGYLPEHTLAAYQLAIDMKADYIEPDLVLTKDGELVCRHENEISGTTDVAAHPEFADRRTTKQIDGDSIIGWFTEDFTLAELKTLRCRERLPKLRKEGAKSDGKYEIPTLSEVLELIVQTKSKTGRSVGIYPETKHPIYFASIKLNFDQTLLATLRKVPLFQDGKGQTPLVFIQSFEVDNLKRLKTLCNYPLIQLLSPSGKTTDGVGDFVKMRTAEGLQEIAKYAAGIGPDKNLVIPRLPTKTLGRPTPLVADAHRAGLKVHPYTFRKEPIFLSASGLTAEEEIAKFIAAGVDGFFTDFPDIGVKVVEAGSH